jgi:DNA (cytosine-5)-methyltransferase 1
LTLGLKKAGFNVIGAIEFDSTAAETFRTNHGDVLLKEADIQTISANALRRELRLKVGELDLLAACPPCQGFSVLRTRNGAQKNRDKRNQLVDEVLRFARAFKPKALMMENVPRLERHASFRRLCSGLRKLGYKLTHAVKDAAAYGVPQRRQRLILVGGRGFDIELAKESSRLRTVRRAIGGMRPPGKSRNALHNLPEKPRAARVQALIRDIPKNGGSRGDLPTKRQLSCHKRCSGFKDIYGRMAWDDVAPTITTGCFNPSKGRFLHPAKDRVITMREAAVLQSFPLRYKFPLERGKQAIATMIGNALPPEFIRRHAAQIRNCIEHHTG